MDSPPSEVVAVTHLLLLNAPLTRPPRGSDAVTERRLGRGHGARTDGQEGRPVCVLSLSSGLWKTAGGLWQDRGRS